MQSYVRDLVTLDLAPHIRCRTPPSPTLLIWGEYDMLMDPAARAYTRAAVPAAQVQCPSYH